MEYQTLIKPEEMKTLDRLLDFAMVHDLTIVSYGLAPNPNGFSFERGDETADEACREFSKMLSQLTNEETQRLKRMVFGVY